LSEKKKSSKKLLKTLEAQKQQAFALI